MENLVFAPLIDIPLAGLTLSAFIWHFNHWASHPDFDAPVDLTSRLHVARWRVIVLITGILLSCWLANLAFWSILPLLICLGAIGGLLANGDLDGGMLGLWAIACLIREWSFGFPQLIPHSPAQDGASSLSPAETDQLVGTTGVTLSALRPMGDVEIDGVKYSAASANGKLLDAGTPVTVMAYRNGLLCVAPHPEPTHGG